MLKLYRHLLMTTLPTAALSILHLCSCFLLARNDLDLISAVPFRLGDGTVPGFQARRLRVRGCSIYRIHRRNLWHSYLWLPADLIRLVLM